MKYINQISKYYNKGIIFDTNILLLLLIGLYDPTLITKFKRVNKYNLRDFGILKDIYSNSNKVIISQPIVTELSNLSFNLSSKLLKSYFKSFCNELFKFKEINRDKNTILINPLFHKLGFTDCSIIEVAKKGKYLVITDDLELYLKLTFIGIPVENFNHLKTSLY